MKNIKSNEEILNPKGIIVLKEFKIEDKYFLQLKCEKDNFIWTNRKDVARRPNFCCPECKKQKLTPKDRGYFKIRENRLSYLKYLIDEYKEDTMNTEEYKKLYDNFYKYKDDIYLALEEIGYKYTYFKNANCPNNYWTKEVIKSEIKNYIDKNNRFPTYQEILRDIKLDGKHLYKHYSSLDELKKDIGYNNDLDLIDNRGDFNKSKIELFVANYLIENGFKDNYKREQHPFENENYRSDFTFYLDNGMELHVEVWGYTESKSKIHIKYLENKRHKKELYEKHRDKIILLEIEYSEMCSLSYEESQIYLYEKFKSYLTYEFKLINFINLISPSSFTDDDIKNEIMKYIDEDGCLPKLSGIPSFFGTEIRKRYGNYKNFSKLVEIPLSKSSIKNYSIEECDDNYIYIKNKLKCIPTRKQFEENTKIDFSAYKKYFKLEGASVYDSIILHYESEDGQIEYFNKKGKREEKYSHLDLELEFERIFSYYNRIPLSTEFNKISNIRYQNYCNILNMKWKEVCEYYSNKLGLTDQNQQRKEAM